MVTLAKEIYKNLTNPITKEKLEESFSKGMLPISKLEKGKYYGGYCRNARVSLWDGEKFIYMRTKFDKIFPEHIEHPEKLLDSNYPFDIFVPLKFVEPKAFEIIKY